MNETKQCESCGFVYPKKHFSRFLTPAQAKTFGYKGQRRVEITSKNCAECRRKKKKPMKALTPKELQTRVASGALSESLVSERLERMRKETHVLKQAAIKRRWAALWHEQWGALLQGISREIKAVQCQLKTARVSGDVALCDFCVAYVAALNAVRLFLRVQHRAPSKAPDYTYWQGFVAGDVVARLHGQATLLAGRQRPRLRVPSLFDKPKEVAFERRLVGDSYLPPEKRIEGFADKLSANDKSA